jgi:hypothetical protein
MRCLDAARRSLRESAIVAATPPPRERQADHVGVGAFDAVDEVRALALDGVRAGAIERLAGRDVGVDLARVSARKTTGVPITTRSAAAPGLEQRTPVKTRVRATRQRATACAARVARPRLPERRRVERDDVSAASIHASAPARATVRGLLVGHALGERVGRSPARAISSMSDARRRTSPELLEQPATPRRRRREHERWQAGADIASSCRSLRGVKHAPRIALPSTQVAERGCASRVTVPRARVLACIVASGACRTRRASPVTDAAAVAHAHPSIADATFAEPSRSTSAARSMRHAALPRLARSYPALADYHLAISPRSRIAGTPREASVFDDRLLAASRRASGSPPRRRGAPERARARRPAAEELAERRGRSRPTTRRARRRAHVLAALRAPTRRARRTSCTRRCAASGGEAAPRAREAQRALEAAHPELLDDPTLLLAEGRCSSSEDGSTRAHALEPRPRRRRGDRVEALRALAKVISRRSLEDALATYRRAVPLAPTGNWRASSSRACSGTAIATPRHGRSSRRSSRRRPPSEVRHGALRARPHRRAGGSHRRGRRAVPRLAARAATAISRARPLALAWMPYRRGDLVAADEAFDALGAAARRIALASLVLARRVLARGMAAREPEQSRARPARGAGRLLRRPRRARVGHAAPPRLPTPSLAAPPSIALHAIIGSGVASCGPSA